MIGLLLRAGAYTENLRRLWDAGLEIEREGFQDARTGSLTFEALNLFGKTGKTSLKLT